MLKLEIKPLPRGDKVYLRIIRGTGPGSTVHAAATLDELKTIKNQITELEVYLATKALDTPPRA